LRYSSDISAKIVINIRTRPKEFDVTVPVGKSSPQVILPFVQEIADQVVEAAVEVTEKEGKSISCKKGCAACCAQLVPISETETQFIFQKIASMAKKKRQAIMQRFEAAKLVFEGAGIWEDLLQPHLLKKERRKELGLKYFQLQQFCPFLENGACSIHEQRPIACREYLVTSDASHCRNPQEGNIDGVDVPTTTSRALGKLCEDDANHVSNWVPLIVAPYWQEKHSDLPAKRTGKEWVERFLNNLS